MKPRTKRILNLTLVVVTLAIVLFFALRDKDLGQVMAAVQSLDWKYALLCTLCFFGTIAMDALSIGYFLRRQGYRVGPGYMMFVSIAGQYYSNITPGASGGQPMQIYYIHQRGVPTAVATSALVVRFFCFQMMLEVIGTVLWLAYGPFISQSVAGNNWILIVGYVYNLCLCLLILTVALVRPVIRFFVNPMLKLGTKLRLIKDPEATRARWLGSVATFHESIGGLMRHPMDFVLQMLMGGLQLLFQMTVIFIVYRGLGYRDATYGQLVSLNVMQFLSAAYTPLPGASGAQEVVFDLYFNQIFSDENRTAALLLWRFFTYYISLVVGAVAVTVFGLRSGQSLREMAEITTKVQEESKRGPM